MTVNIILAGVGGQGILSIATVLGQAALTLDLNLKQAEVHGMSQRGGDVMSCLRLSDSPIASDLIPAGKVDMIVSMEPMEALRYVPQLKADGVIITASAPVANVPNYPEAEKLINRIKELPVKSVVIDADAIARTVASPRSSNMVLLGAASDYLWLAPEVLENAIAQVFAAKGDAIVQSNIKAFRAGLAASNENV